MMYEQCTELSKFVCDLGNKISVEKDAEILKFMWDLKNKIL